MNWIAKLLGTQLGASAGVSNEARSGRTTPGGGPMYHPGGTSNGKGGGGGRLTPRLIPALDVNSIVARSSFVIVSVVATSSPTREIAPTLEPGPPPIVASSTITRSNGTPRAAGAAASAQHVPISAILFTCLPSSAPRPRPPSGALCSIRRMRIRTKDFLPRTPI